MTDNTVSNNDSHLSLVSRRVQSYKRFRLVISSSEKSILAITAGVAVLAAHAMPDVQEWLIVTGAVFSGVLFSYIKYNPDHAVKQSANSTLIGNLSSVKRENEDFEKLVNKLLEVNKISEDFKHLQKVSLEKIAEHKTLELELKDNLDKILEAGSETITLSQEIKMRMADGHQ